MTSYVGHLKELYSYENINFLSRRLVDVSIFEKIVKINEDEKTMFFMTPVVYEYYSFFADEGYDKLPERTLDSIDIFYRSVLSAKDYSVEKRLGERGVHRASLFMKEMMAYLCGDFLFRMCSLGDLCQLVKIDDNLVYLCHGYYEFEIEGVPYYEVYFLYKRNISMLVFSMKIEKIFPSFSEHMDKKFCCIVETEFVEIQDFLETCVIKEKKLFDYKKDFTERDEKKFDTIVSKHFLDEEEVMKS